MAIPDYQTLMLPLLTLLADGKERSFSQVPPPLADQFELTAEDRARLLPSG
jgi:restriction system protein